MSEKTETKEERRARRQEEAAREAAREQPEANAEAVERSVEQESAPGPTAEVKDLREQIGISESTQEAPEGVVPEDLDPQEVGEALAGTTHTIGSLLATTAQNFEVLHDNLGFFHKGDKVTLQQLGGDSQSITRLIELGAVRPLDGG